ncbi:nitrate reductase associated protein [Candidatus Binatus soli]|jgi:hypothetical protein|uniref:nitrate reductase associated protein n=1 Tax=Candidatus Binatus soli TaxID=1953413 RepID=UPI003D0B407B
MFRRFDFEKELYETLEFIPLSVRRKLDLAGVKLHLKEWQALSRVERLVICHFPAGSPEERDVLAAFLREAVKRRAGTDVGTMKPAAHDDAPDAGQVPPDVARLIAELGLPEKRWSLLDPDERFALAKMARGGADKFMSAWSEFADKR